MSKNGENATGPFDEFLGRQASDSETFSVSYERPSRVWFQKSDGETISVAYVRMTLMHYDGRDIVLSVGEHVIRIEGERLMSLYEALHDERVTKVRERGQDSLAEFGVGPTDGASGGEAAAVVQQILWDQQLLVEG